MSAAKTRPLTCALWLILGAALALGAQRLGGFAAGQDDEKKPRDPYLALNGAFRAAYSKTKKDLTKAADPVLFEEGGKVVLLHAGKRSERAYQSPRYDEVKTICHVPLALHVMLLNQTDLGDEPIAELGRFRDKVVAAQKTLKERGYEGDLLARQEKVVADSLTFLDGVVKRRKVSAEELKTFTLDMGKQMTPLVDEIARLQIDTLDVAVQAFRKELSDEEWQRLKVVVMGSAMPRQQQIVVQYFARLLGEPGEGRRIIYAEGLWTEDRALDLLGKHLLDGPIGRDFFGDDRRMMRDLLADAAKEYLARKERKR